MASFLNLLCAIYFMKFSSHSEIFDTFRREPKDSIEKPPQFQNSTVVVVASKVGQHSVDRSPKVFIGHFVSFNFAVKRFDFPAGPFDSVTVATHDNFAGLGQGKLSLAVFERLSQRDGFRLRNAHCQLQTGGLGDISFGSTPGGTMM